MAHRRVVIALDSFKGSISAASAAAALARGIGATRPDLTLHQVPIADGGEGTVATLVAAGFAEVPVTVCGPLGSPVGARLAMRGHEAVVELATAAGLHLLPGAPTARTALDSSTFGVGELIDAAVRRGATTVVVGLGGSCSTDGGAGLAQALGARLTAVDGTELPRGGGALSRLHTVVPPDRRAGVRIVAATDVGNSLLGSSGAARIYGPQKGAGPDEVDVLERALTRWADVVREATGAEVRDRPGTGAAGGTGFALAALFDAEIVSGIDLVLDLVGFDDLAGPDALVVVGEGSLDAQTLNGKGPLGVARRAQAHGAQVVAVAGRSTLSPDACAAAGLGAVHTLQALEPDPARSMAEAASLLEAIGRRIGPQV